jgi:endonuclease I
MFYMANQYKDSGLILFEKQQRLLLAWHNADPPNAVEKVRNNRIEQIQGNRNPFVDKPAQLEKMVKSGQFKSRR